MNFCVDQLQEYETQQAKYSCRETTIMTVDQVDHLHLIKIILLQQEPGGQEDSPCHVLLPPPPSPTSVRSYHLVTVFVCHVTGHVSERAKLIRTCFQH